MRTRHKVEGITLIGFVVLLAVLGFFAYLAMRLVPMYVEYFGVLKSMEQLRQEPGAAQMSLPEIRNSLSLKFNTQYVDETSVTPQSSSSVVTPIASARANPASVFSGARPRAPRCPCRSNARASAACADPGPGARTASQVAAAIRMSLFLMVPPSCRDAPTAPR